MKPFIFVHAADLHIDSPFKGVTAQDGSVARQLRDATLKSYQNIIDLCIDVGASFLVVAGDIYDGADRSIHAQFAFVDGLKRLTAKGIPSYIAHGNHDPLDGWCNALEVPELAYVFADQVESQIIQARNGQPLACIVGMSYPHNVEERNLIPEFARLEISQASELFKIAVLHCNVGGDLSHANYAPCTLQDFAAARFNYWALGHVHERKILRENPWDAYPGNSQGRNVRELGARGCYVVTVNSPTNVQIEFKATDAVRWLAGSIPIDGLTTLNDLEAAVLEITAELARQSDGRPLICRLTLEGRGPIYHELRQLQQQYDFLSRCRQRLNSTGAFRWIAQIDYDCRPDINWDEVKKRKDLASFVLKEADTLRSENLRDAILQVVAPLYQNPHASPFLSVPDGQECEKLLDEAALMCFDKLENG